MLVCVCVCVSESTPNVLHIALAGCGGDPHMYSAMRDTELQSVRVRSASAQTLCINTYEHCINFNAIRLMHVAGQCVLCCYL